ncbi:hypothetical protein DSM104299_05442 [Baekduia alba]|uniref:DUF4331 family protein n=1 Tax=Baekduia alba TaxID=2997333 RepID=UPI002341C81A|nr:DUF4331 family protein [Baekduia alba]WCB96676.1 hypothetical protein DSM104299_05442 [Baekduia alba]
MSHHLDYSDPTLDITDVFCFGGTKSTVMVLNVAPNQTTGFNPAGMYELKLDTSTPLDYVEDITFRVTVPDPQHFRLEMLTGNQARDRYAVGTLLATGSVGTTVVCSNGVKVFVGERGEPFYIDPRWLVAIKGALSTGTAADVDSLDPNTSQNAFGQSNVSSIVVEVPTAITGGHKLGFWGNSSLKDESGVWHQAQHAANPLIGVLYDFAHGSAATSYNGTTPKEQLDAKNNKTGVWEQVRDETTAVVAAMGTYSQGAYGKPTAAAYGRYVANTVFPDVLTYNPGTTAGYGPLVPAGPRDQNGRGLTEQSIEAIFEVVLNRHVEMGLDASDATGQLLTAFPYLSDPIAGG